MKAFDMHIRKRMKKYIKKAKWHRKKRNNRKWQEKYIEWMRMGENEKNKKNDDNIMISR